MFITQTNTPTHVPIYVNTVQKAQLGVVRGSSIIHNLLVKHRGHAKPSQPKWRDYIAIDSEFSANIAPFTSKCQNTFLFILNYRVAWRNAHTHAKLNPFWAACINWFEFSLHTISDKRTQFCWRDFKFLFNYSPY